MDDAVIQHLFVLTAGKPAWISLIPLSVERLIVFEFVDTVKK